MASSPEAGMPVFAGKLVKKWRSGRGCDVEIKCQDGQTVKAHSVVLGSLSDKLEEILEESEDSCIVSEDVDVGLWNMLLECVYTGVYRTDLSISQLNALIDLARFYDITAVVSKLVEMRGSGTEKVSKEIEKGDKLVENRNTMSEGENVEAQAKRMKLSEKSTDRDSSIEATEVGLLLSLSTGGGSDVSTKVRPMETELSSDLCNDIPDSTVNPNNSVNQSMTLAIKTSDASGANSGQEITGTAETIETNASKQQDVTSHKQVDPQPVEEGDQENRPTTEGMGDSSTTVLGTIKYPSGGENVQAEPMEEGSSFKKRLSELMKGEPKKTKASDGKDKEDTSQNEQKPSGYQTMRQLLTEGKSKVDYQSVKKNVIEIKVSGRRMTVPQSSETPVPFCFQCWDNCSTDKVLCLLCFSVVSDKAAHISDIHKYTPNTSFWPYTCDTERHTFPEDAQVFAKLQVHQFPEKSQAQSQVDGPVFYCHSCSGEFTSVDDLCAHIVHMYRCTFCRYAFPSADLMREHLSDKHQVQQVFECSTCESGFTDPALHREHQYYCGGGGLRLCDLCDKVVWSSRQWEQHEQCQGENVVKTEPLDSSDFSSFEAVPSSENNGQIAMLKTDRSGLYTKMCLHCGPYCGASSVRCLYCYQSVDVLSRVFHMKTMHPLTPASSLWPVDCDLQAGGGEMGPAILSLYTFITSPDTDQAGDQSQILVKVSQVVCAVCQEEQMSSEELEIHLKREHGIEAPPTCGLCFTMISPSWPDLYNDHSNLCPGGSFYRCLQCARYFGSLQSANSHWAKEHPHVQSEADAMVTEITNEVVKKKAGKPAKRKGPPEIRIEIDSPADKKMNLRDHSSHKFFGTYRKTIQDGTIIVTPIEKGEEAPQNPNLNPKYKSLLANLSGKKAGSKAGPRKETDSPKKSQSGLMKNVKPRRGEDVCVTCIASQRECPDPTSKVLCLYCNEIVSRSSNHRLHNHPFTPIESLWPFTCDLSLFPGSKGKRIFVKEQKHNNQQASKQGHYNCQMCRSKFDTMEVFMDHITYQYKCKCKLSFSKLGAILKHMSSHHSFPEVFFCKICHSAFRSHERLKVHEYYCDRGQILSCNQCERKFWRPEDFTEHMKEDHQPEGESQNVEGLTVTSIDAESGVVTVEPLAPLKQTRILNPRAKKPKKRTVTEAVKSKCEELVIPRAEAHLTVCLDCPNSACQAMEVTCGYCGVRVAVNEKINHFTFYHSQIPQSSLWPVHCQQEVPEIFSTDTNPMLSREVVMLNLNVAEVGSEERTGRLCQMCVLCQESQNVLTSTENPEQLILHLSDDHAANGVACPQCGMVLRESCESFVQDHLNLCSGGQVIRCKQCSILSGSWHSALQHYKKCCPDEEEEEEEMKNLNKKERKGNTGPRAHHLSMGKHGYQIMCVGCTGHCTELGRSVKCRLCGDVVPKDDIHMKTKHPFSQSKVWVVKCCFADNQFFNYYLGEKVKGEPSHDCPYYMCLVCSAAFKKAETLCQHIEEAHLRDLDPTRPAHLKMCPTCGAAIKDVSYTYNFMDHVQFCERGQLFACDKCDFQTGSGKAMKAHKCARQRQEEDQEMHETDTSPAEVDANSQEIQHVEVQVLKGAKKPRSGLKVKTAWLAGNYETVGEHGYQIICLSCNGNCTELGKPVKCRLCGDVVPKNDIHMKTKHPFSQSKVWFVKCSFAENQFSNYYVGEKLNTDASNLKYKCLVCSQAFISGDVLFEHIKETHIMDLYTTKRLSFKACPVCEAVIKDVQHTFNFMDHVQFCMEGKLFKCDKCEFECGNGRRLKNHQSVMHRTKPGQKENNEEKGLQPKVKKEGPMVCDLCAFSTAAFSDMKIHIKEQHGLKNVITCRFCNKVFVSPRQREYHEQAQHSKEPLLCDTCGKAFEIPSKLKQHIRYHHLGHSKFYIERSRRNRSKRVCPHCGDLFSGGHRLNMHINAVHLKKEELKCHVCGRFCGTKHELRIHVNRHLKHKPFKCDLCDFAAYKRYKLTAHKKKAHMDTLDTDTNPPADLPPPPQLQAKPQPQKIQLVDFNSMEVTEIPFDYVLTT